MTTTALGIAPDSNGVGVDVLTHRRIIGAQWANTGIISGLQVTGRSDLTWAVASGAAVSSRAPADGKVISFWPGGQTPATLAGDPSNPRIDIVYLAAHDIGQGDSDNHVVLGVLRGQPAASPVPPNLATIPGALRLRAFRIPAGAASTNAAVALDTYSYAIPHGASLGMLGENVDTTDGVGDRTPGKYVLSQPISFYLPTDRLVQFDFTGCISAEGDDDDDPRGGWFINFQVDGVDLPRSGAELDLTATWQAKSHSVIAELPAGQHTAMVRSGYIWGERPVFHYAPRESQGSVQYIGRVFRVWDRGVTE